MKNKFFYIKYLLTLILINSLINCYCQEKRNINQLVPREFILQYAGSIGFLSLGISYPVYQDKLDLSFHYGYVPEAFGGKLDILTAKLKYKPFKYTISDKITFFPTNPVLFPSYTLNNGFHFLWPKDKYGKNLYYWWSSALRLHLGASSDVLFNEVFSQNDVAVFFEANITDLYFTSYFKNPDYLSLWKTIRFGTGIRIIIN